MHKFISFVSLRKKTDVDVTFYPQEYLCLDECFVSDLRGEDDDDEDSLARTPRRSDSQYSSLSSRVSCLSSGPPGYAPGHPDHVFAVASTSSGLNDIHSVEDPLLVHRPEVPPRFGVSLSRTHLAPDGTLESVEELTSTV